MTVLRDGREVLLECDQCPETTDTYADFEHMIHEAKKAGWRVAAVRGDWTHTCPDCQGGSRLDRARALFK